MSENRILIFIPVDLLIETERLLIRPIALTDEAGMFEMDSDPQVHRHLGNRPYTHTDQSRDNINYMLQQYNNYGIGRWAIEEKETSDFVGWTGFKYIKGPINGYSDYYDFGYRLKRKHWGRGIASEAGIASLHYGIKTLSFKGIYGMTHVDNRASRRVLEKLGFRYIETFGYDAPEPVWVPQGTPITWYKQMAPHP